MIKNARRFDSAAAPPSLGITAPLRKWAPSVRSRRLGGVDDEDVGGGLGGLELKAGLLLQSGEDGWAAGERRVSWRVVGRPMELEIIAAGEAGLVDEAAAGGAFEDGSDVVHGAIVLNAQAVAHGRVVTASGRRASGRCGAARGCGRERRGFLHLQAAFGQDDVVNGEGAHLMMDAELEAVGEHGLLHISELAGGERSGGQVGGIDFGIEVEEI